MLSSRYKTSKAELENFNIPIDFVVVLLIVFRRTVTVVKKTEEKKEKVSVYTSLSSKLLYVHRDRTWSPGRPPRLSHSS